MFVLALVLVPFNVCREGTDIEYIAKKDIASLLLVGLWLTL
jgi:hypothetical protein